MSDSIDLGAKGRLTGLTGQNLQASYRYDALGRRIEKTVNGQSVGYLYDGSQAIAELVGSSVNAAYHPGTQIDEILARYTTSGQKTLLQDALGSVIAQSAEDGSTATRYAYSPYGEVQVIGPDEGSPIQYTGRENDGTGLYYYRARYYDPLLKRFISEDPIGLAGGINVYGYVGGNPVGARDPLGLWSSVFNVKISQDQATAMASQGLQKNGLSKTDADRIAADITNELNVWDVGTVRTLEAALKNSKTLTQEEYDSMINFIKRLPKKDQQPLLDICEKYAPK